MLAVDGIASNMDLLISNNLIDENNRQTFALDADLHVAPSTRSLEAHHSEIVLMSLTLHSLDL